MINIYTKTAKEIEKENDEYRYGAALVKGIPRKACPTYLMRRDGTKVDTRDLTEGQILRLIENDVKDHNSKGEDVFKLLDVIKNTWTPSYNAIYQLLGMESKYGNVMMDILGTADKNNIRGDARKIASFQKQCNGDFSDVTIREIMGIIQQMAYNEQMKKQQQSSGMRR